MTDTAGTTDFTEQIAELTEKATAITEKLEGKSLATEQVDELKTQLEGIQEEVNTLAEARKVAEVELERKALIERMDTLTSQMESVGQAMPNFFPAAPSNENKAVYGESGEFSYFNDVRRARKGDSSAQKRIDDYFEGKAMGESIDATGGFLVPPEVSNELIPLRDSVSVLRQLFTAQPVSSDTLRFVGQDSGLAVAWTAEFAEKISNDLSFSEFEAHIFTAAGLATVSNQLLADAKWNVDQLITKDLAKRFVALEEQAFINGSGVGQPLGIMNTPGVTSIPYKAAEPKQVELLDKISDGITEVQTKFLGFPDGIVMHPRTWGWLVKGRETESPSVYFVGSGANGVGRRASDPLPGYPGNGVVPRGELFGLPVYCTPNVPTTLGGGTESAVIVGDFSQGLVLDREGITTDTSEHVFFTSNQTVFRSEERVGFTAGRYPNAFAVVQGSGMAGH